MLCKNGIEGKPLNFNNKKCSIQFNSIQVRRGKKSQIKTTDEARFSVPMFANAETLMLTKHVMGFCAFF